MKAVEQAVVQTLEAYKAAVFAKDVDAFTALYDTNVRVFDLWGKWSYDGIEAWREMVDGWFGSLGSERVVVEMDEVQIVVSQQLAMVHAFVTYTGRSAEGEKLRAMHNRLTWALRLHGDAWKIVHEHTSAPVDFDNAKVMLKR